ncbi:MAG: hypothetical protein ACFCD0_10805, partial [Gemmataceae bacterium]
MSLRIINDGVKKAWWSEPLAVAWIFHCKHAKPKLPLVFLGRVLRVHRPLCTANRICYILCRRIRPVFFSNFKEAKNMAAKTLSPEELQAI